jgi:uncharacterized membrane protein YphA (DoxX/SURF4 family)
MSTVTRYLPTAARIVLGLIFFVFGLNGFLNFLHAPPPEGAAGAFAGALLATGYMFPLIKGTEVLGGLLLLSGRFVPFALTILAPVIVNIVLFHLVLAPPNPITFLVPIAEIYLAYAYRDAFRGVLSANAKPAAAAVEAPAAGVSARAPA